MTKKCTVLTCLMVMLVCVSCGSVHPQETRGAAKELQEPEQGKEESLKRSMEEDEASDSEETQRSNEYILEVEKAESENTTESKDYTVVSDVKPSEGLEFESNGDGTCILKGIGVCTDEELVIPIESPKGEKLVQIEEYAFYNLEDVSSVTLVNCEYEIDNYAFQYGQFTSIHIIGGSPIIGKSAFSSCEDLETVEISDCNLQMDEYAFFGCGKDAKVVFSNCSGVIDEYAFQYSDMLTLEVNNCDLQVGKSAFSTCENLESIMVSNTSIKADEYAFFSCGDSAKVEMIDCEVVLDDYAFQYSSLGSLLISGAKLEAGKSSFSSCEDLSSVTIDCGSLVLDEYAFFGCEDLINVSIDENADEDVQISVEDYTFQYCKRLETVIIGKGTIEMGKNVFTGCADALKISNNGTVYTAESVEEAFSS